jgi:hypothetical protein
MNLKSRRKNYKKLYKEKNYILESIDDAFISIDKNGDNVLIEQATVNI